MARAADVDVTSAPAPPIARRRGWPRPEPSVVKRGLYLLVLSALSIIFVYPFFWAVSASLKPTADVFDNRLIPQEVAWDNYSKVWDAAQLSTWLINSLYVGFAAAGR